MTSILNFAHKNKVEKCAFVYRRSHVDWREEQNIFYKGGETFP